AIDRGAELLHIHIGDRPGDGGNENQQGAFEAASELRRADDDADADEGDGDAAPAAPAHLVVLEQGREQSGDRYLDLDDDAGGGGIGGLEPREETAPMDNTQHETHTQEGWQMLAFRQT